MANKKIFMSVTASAVIASAFIGAEDADAASYKVKSGDSLWSIAQKYNTNVSHLKSWNDLSSNLIFPNQVLETSKTQSSNSTTESNNQSTKSTYKVKSGDTLSGIASKHNISLSQLKKWNNLDSWLIYPGDVFVVSRDGASSGSSADSGSDSSASAGSGSGSGSGDVYTVKSGDTLSEIGVRKGASVADLKRWNNLSSSIIYVGQKLNIGSAKAGAGSSSSDSGSNSGSSGSSAGGSAVDTDYNVNKLISTAKSLKGVGYAWGGTSPAGFDCSGYIYYVYNKAGKNISRTSTSGYFNRSYYVNNPQVGDLVFFENTYKSGISHMGIYIGNNKFIQASSDGVEITSLSNPYWDRHFDSFKRFY